MCERECGRFRVGLNVAQQQTDTKEVNCFNHSAEVIGKVSFFKFLSNLSHNFPFFSVQALRNENYNDNN